MSGWRRCDTCRKVRPATDFDGEATTCAGCLAPAPQPTRRRAGAVTRVAPATRTSQPRTPAPQTAEPRRPLLGSVGSGDLEVRERRARRTAGEALAAAHPDEHARLLQEARAAEGLRSGSERAPAGAASGGTGPVEHGSGQPHRDADDPGG